MSSTHSVNFSLRQNKSIEREIVFDGLGRLITELSLDNPLYVGFGSVWFVDFEMAHRQLHVKDMISIEHDPIVFERAKFNRPFRTVEILSGSSRSVLPSLLEREDLVDRPWIIWLDYDSALQEDEVEELQYLVESLPDNSLLLTTFSALPRGYGGNPPSKRPEYISNLFGQDIVETYALTTKACKEDHLLMPVLAGIVEDVLKSAALRARSGSYVPLFSIVYQDAAPMVTVGGMLPSRGLRDRVETMLAGPSWPGRETQGILTPPLTPKEVQALRSLLPSASAPTREDIQALGFDLEDGQLASFVTHYLKYPTFAQLAR